MILPTFTDEHNIKLNSACGIWQYLAHLWEIKQNRNVNNEAQKSIVDSINECIKDLDPICIKSIIESYNNEHIIELIGDNQIDSNKKSDDRTIIHEKW
jgi:hypothetical protein